MITPLGLNRSVEISSVTAGTGRIAAFAPDHSLLNGVGLISARRRPRLLKGRRIAEPEPVRTTEFDWFANLWKCILIEPLQVQRVVEADSHCLRYGPTHNAALRSSTQPYRSRGELRDVALTSDAVIAQIRASTCVVNHSEMGDTGRIRRTVTLRWLVAIAASRQLDHEWIGFIPIERLHEEFKLAAPYAPVEYDEAVSPRRLLQQNQPRADILACGRGKVRS